MSINVPTPSDTAWAVNGTHRRDYGGNKVWDCVIISGGNCSLPTNHDFSKCSVRCFGNNPIFMNPPKPLRAENRSIEDTYDGQPQWPEDGLVDLWVWPRNCAELRAIDSTLCTYNIDNKVTPSYNPQGFTFTFAGNGNPGLKDGDVNVAMFNGPRGVALDNSGNHLVVADTLNNAIRLVANGKVSTIAGKGSKSPGAVDGKCSNATFNLPKGLDVTREMITWGKYGPKDTLVIFVADTGNHRIRRIEYWNKDNCIVRCLTGLCGNNTLSLTESQFKAFPYAGYADGIGLEARFSAPEGVALLDNGYLAVADTGNFLIRYVLAENGTTYTLAGRVGPGLKEADGTPLAGCPPPCMAGIQGYQDGNLTFAQFYKPTGVSKGQQNSIYVADEQRIRLIEMPGKITNIQSIQSKSRVSTLAGNALQGHEDGRADESTFFESRSVFVTGDNVAYVADAASCRIRRISPMPLVAEKIDCSTTPQELIRPSGCTSYDPVTDETGRKISRVEKNIQYNYGAPYSYDTGNDVDRGKYIKNCVGSPPPDVLDKHFLFQGQSDNLVVDDNRTIINEDSEQGMAIMVFCKAGCASSVNPVYGTKWYSDDSSICRAAIHAKIIGNKGGYLQIILQRYAYIWNTTYNNGSTSNGVTSKLMAADTFRIFSMEKYNESMSVVHSIAGHPSAKLESNCKYGDGQPAVAAFFNLPSGLAARKNTSLSNVNFLYVADSMNHRIRGISAVCTQICENGGNCIASDTCACKTGWTGVDCTKPVCKTACVANQVCVGPDTCKCKPGFQASCLFIMLCY